MNTTCRRCRGTGIFETAKGPAPCFSCGGSKVARKVTQFERDVARATDTLDRFARDPRRIADYRAMNTALRHLRSTSPERFVKLVASVNAGRVADTHAALVTYATTIGA